MLPTLDGSARYLFFIPFVLTKVITIIFFLFVSRMTWFAFFLFTVLHVFANLRAVKAVTMETLNRARFLIILKQYASTKTVSSIKDVNKLEPVVMGLIPTGNLRSVTKLLDYLILQVYYLEKDVCGYRIELGSSIKLLASVNTGFEFELLIADNYLLKLPITLGGILLWSLVRLPRQSTLFFDQIARRKRCWKLTLRRFYQQCLHPAKRLVE